MEAHELIQKKDDIEAELLLQSQILESNANVGMDGPLVDREGFPRDDIDIYAVRRARNKIICLRNDHKDIMRLIEQHLHVIHAEAREKGYVSTNTERSEEEDKIVTFARITMISEGSPASIAGLKVGDGLVEFGSVTAANFTGLPNIADIVQHSEGRPIRVIVLRDKKSLVLSLTPQRWAGRGLLGCVIAPQNS